MEGKGEHQSVLSLVASKENTTVQNHAQHSVMDMRGTRRAAHASMK